MPSSQMPPLATSAIDPTSVRPPIDDAVIERIEPAGLRARLETLKSEGFALLLDVGAADYPQRKPRFDVVYHLLKLTGTPATVQQIGSPQRYRLLCGVGEEDPTVPTVSDLWKSADWAEREIYDLFGIQFSDHPDLRRIQMPVHWEGYPLRKDYPLRGPAREKAPRPDFALKSNIASGTPATGKTAQALAEQVMQARKDHGEQP